MSNTITIVGGFYRERCRFPPNDDFWGSGGRAAAAISELGHEVTFITAVDDATKPTLASIAANFGLKISTFSILHTIQFRYDHGLSVPIIWPPPHTLTRVRITASADCILQFGMLDAEVEVEARTAIYDPQEPFSPQHFSAKNKPKRLAYVLNSAEARRLGANEGPERAAAKILQDSKADVVVIKRGPRGALVFEKGKANEVPAFHTNRVWPIGSGDVFAAVFAERWGLQNIPAVEAARSASQAAAEYVENPTLPVAREAIEGIPSRAALNLTFRPLSATEYHVYLAGPFFNMPQLWLIEEARESLRGMGLRVFSPYHDVGIGSAEQVASKDIQALENSRVVLAMLDGMDSGTIFEIGFARALSKPVVAFTQCTPEEPLKMIRGTGCEIVNDFVSAIYHTAWGAWL